MKRLVILLGPVVCLGLVMNGCSTPEEDPPETVDPEPVACSIISPAAEDVVNGDIEVQIQLEGPVTLVELLVEGDVVDDLVPNEGDSTASFTFDTTDVDDGTVELTAHVVGDASEGIEDTSEPVEVLVDNTEPVISLDLDRMAILTDIADVPVTIDEANVVSVRLLNQEDEELISVEEATNELNWDTTEVDSMVHWIRLEVEDVAGNVVETEAIPVVVANNGYVVEQDQLLYDGIWMIIPEPWDPEAYLHMKIAAPLDVEGSQPTKIVRLVTWLTWDAEAGDGLVLQYATGQGICPHRGVQYAVGESSEGEIIIDLAWVDVPAAAQNAALVHDPDHPDDAVTFPYNGDIATCGSFFGHVAPFEPEEHLGVEFTFTAHFVFLFN